MNGSDDFYLEHPAIEWAGRFLFTLIFFLSGITHFTDIESYTRLMPPGTPFATFWVLVSGVVELAGAIMILSGRYARLGAWLLVLFLVPVTIVVHGYLMVTATEPQMQQIQLSFFLKGLAMTGAALVFTQVGVRRSAQRA